MPNRQWGNRASRAARAAAPGRQRRLATRVLAWLLALLVIFVLLSLLFGGFQKGQKAGLGSRSGQRFQSAAQEVALGAIARPGARRSTAS
jgi:ABC-type Fe3+ transport system permease subunit